MLAAPHACLAGVLYNQWKFAEAEQAFARAFALQPNYAMAHHWRAHMMGSIGRLDEALHEMERALALDPLAFISRWTHATHLNMAGRHEAAIQNIDRGLKISPRFIPLHGDRALALEQLGRMDEAVAEARIVTGDLSFLPRFYADSDAVHVLRRAGLEAEAEAFAQKVIADLPANSHHRAFLLAALGRPTEGLGVLVTARPSTMSRVFYHPIWEPVRNTPHLDAVLKKLGCEKEYRLAQQTAAQMRREKR
jgi:tetratricopeptide (TPR) repeat protein